MVTRTPCSCSSARSESASARRPNFEAAYADQLRVRDQAGAGVDEDDGAARRPAAPGRQTRVSTAGATRLTASCDCQASVVSSATGPRSTTPAACTTESSDVRQLVGDRLDRGGVGEVGDQHGRVRQLGAQVVGALGRAGQQHQRVAALEQPLGEDRADAGAGAGDAGGCAISG